MLILMVHMRSAYVSILKLVITVLYLRKSRKAHKVWKFAITNIFLEKCKCVYVLSCVCMVLNKVFLNCSLPYFKQCFSLNLELVVWPIVAVQWGYSILHHTNTWNSRVHHHVQLLCGRWCLHSVIFPDPLIIYFY